MTESAGLIARLIVVSYFIGTMIWVYVGLRKEYVNLEAPSKKPWFDLRLLVVLSMLPHIVVYLLL